MGQELSQNLKVLFSAEALQQRVRELAKQISADYKGKAITAVAVLDNGFMFMADLVRQLEGQVVCQFLKPVQTDTDSKVEIVYHNDMDVRGQHILLVEGLVQSGVTSRFIMDWLLARGAASVRLAALLDKQSLRRVELQPDYFGFMVNESFLVGYGLGAPHLGRNLPYVASVSASGTSSAGSMKPKSGVREN